MTFTFIWLFPLTFPMERFLTIILFPGDYVPTSLTCRRLPCPMLSPRGQSLKSFTRWPMLQISESRYCLEPPKVFESVQTTVTCISWLWLYIIFIWLLSLHICRNECNKVSMWWQFKQTKAAVIIVILSVIYKTRIMHRSFILNSCLHHCLSYH